jgi:hypothetical protein
MRLFWQWFTSSPRGGFSIAQTIGSGNFYEVGRPWREMLSGGVWSGLTGSSGGHSGPQRPTLCQDRAGWGWHQLVAVVDAPGRRLGGQADYHAGLDPMKKQRVLLNALVASFNC